MPGSQYLLCFRFVKALKLVKMHLNMEAIFAVVIVGTKYFEEKLLISLSYQLRLFYNLSWQATFQMINGNFCQGGRDSSVGKSSTSHAGDPCSNPSGGHPMHVWEGKRLPALKKNFYQENNNKSLELYILQSKWTLCRITQYQSTLKLYL